MTHSPTPWRWKELTQTIAVWDANGRTVCSLPIQKDRERRRANAMMIVRAVNALALADSGTPQTKD